jgi:hypothetical protein
MSRNSNYFHILWEAAQLNDNIYTVISAISTQRNGSTGAEGVGSSRTIREAIS